TVCVVGKMRDLILQLSKSSIYSTKPQQSRPALARTGLNVSPTVKTLNNGTSPRLTLVAQVKTS
ncbi:hypothetical protein ACR2WY_26850, partial [Klebsiella pneumoniae]